MMIRTTTTIKMSSLQVNSVADLGSFRGTTLSNSVKYIVPHDYL